mmetsp:Transcript_21388/g.49775  ORF Transcript_21388/g.49775 Transcript_21388/m.49775 type:complete len:245 (-) Transcript_21388:2692-3426(-)
MRTCIFGGRVEAPRTRTILKNHEADLGKLVQLYDQAEVLSFPGHKEEVVAPSSEAQPHSVLPPGVQQLQLLRNGRLAADLLPVHLHPVLTILGLPLKLYSEHVSGEATEVPVGQRRAMAPGAEECPARRARDHSLWANHLAAVLVADHVEVVIPIDWNRDLHRVHVPLLWVGLHCLVVELIPATSHLVGTNQTVKARSEGSVGRRIFVRLLRKLLPIYHPPSALNVKAYPEPVSGHGGVVVKDR